MPETTFPDVKPWPAPLQSGAPAPVGHNKPPLEELIPLEFREELLKGERADFLQKVDDLEGSASRAPQTVTDDDQLAKMGDLVKSLRNARKHVEAVHVIVKEPYLQGGRLADAEKNALLGRINAAGLIFEKEMNRYNAERQAKLRAAQLEREAEQRRQQQEAAAAEALRQEAAETNDVEAMEQVPIIPQAAYSPPPEPERLRSDAGTLIGTKKVWNSEVTDYAAAFAEVSDNANVRAAVDKAIAALVRAGKRTLPGVRIWDTDQVTAR